MPVPDRALGLDLGSKRIGIAVSAGVVATPYEVLPRSGSRRVDHDAINGFVAETAADIVVVGLPRSMNGTIGDAARKILREVDVLRDVLDVPVQTWDERLTTVTADRVLAEQGLDARRRRAVVDQVAASVILQSWLDATGHHEPAEEHDR